MAYTRNANTVQRYTSLGGSKITVNTTTRICDKDISVTKDTEQRVVHAIKNNKLSKQTRNRAVKAHSTRSPLGAPSWELSISG